MTTEEARSLIAQLKAAFPRQEITAETLAMYAGMTADLEFRTAQTAVLALIARSKYFPSIAEIREEAAERMSDLPSATNAWLEVEAAIRRFSPDDSSTWTYDDDYSSPAVALAARSMGGVAVMHEAPQLGFVRRDFIAAYGEIRRAGIRERQVEAAIIGSLPPGLVSQMKRIDP